MEIVDLPRPEDPTLPEGLSDVMVRTCITMYRVVVVVGSRKCHGGR